LKAGQLFLYQVFHGNTVSWQRLFIKAARDNEFETVEKMIVFFQSHPAFINSKEPKSANTALHWACRNGHFVSYKFTWQFLKIHIFLIDCMIDLLWLMPLSAIFQLYHGDQF